MKALFLSILFVITQGLTIHSVTASGQQTSRQPEIVEAEFKVLGLCGMCKSRIEKAAFSVRGVRSASWDQKNQLLKVNYRSRNTDQATIERAIAKAGHDTQNFITDEKTHANLHHCCKYPRDPEMLKNNKLWNQQ